MDPPQWSGYLAKKSTSSFITTWSRRYFILDHTTLTTYEDRGPDGAGRNMKGRMGAGGAALARLPDDRHKRACVFEVAAGAETLTLQADAPAQLEAFAAALAAASAAAPAMRGELSHLVPAAFGRARGWALRHCTLSGGVVRAKLAL